MRKTFIIFLSVLFFIFLAVHIYAIQADQCEGKPKAFDSGEAIGYAFWSDGKEFNLRWTTKKKEMHTFSGTVTSDKPVEDVKGVRLENSMEESDMVTKSAPQKIEFSASTGKGVDGFKFKSPGAKHVTLRLELDGELIDTSRIFCGKGGVHPKENPLKWHRLED